MKSSFLASVLLAISVTTQSAHAWSWKKFRAHAGHAAKATAHVSAKAARGAATAYANRPVQPVYIDNSNSVTQPIGNTHSYSVYHSPGSNYTTVNQVY